MESGRTYDLVVVQHDGSYTHKGVVDFTADHLGGLVVYGPGMRRIAAYAPGGWLFARELLPTVVVTPDTYPFKS